jgi:hypothetical protein
MAAGDGVPDLSDFQLEVARLFFALPDSRGFLLAGGAALLEQHLTAQPGRPKTSTSSPLPNAGMFLPRAMHWRPQSATMAGPRSESMTVTRSAGWSSAALIPGTWLT